MLAYVFWHRPGDDDAAGYEAVLRAFHAALTAAPPPGFRGSVTYARAALPWFDGYEDWYLVDDWTALGVLNDAAPGVAGHDVAARRSAEGTAAVYRLTDGVPDLATVKGATWSDAPVTGHVCWRRQLVLGPAPQYCAHHRSGGAVPRAVVAAGRRP